MNTTPAIHPDQWVRWEGLATLVNLNETTFCSYQEPSSQGQTQGANGADRERVCVCVCEREKERQTCFLCWMDGGVSIVIND